MRSGWRAVVLAIGIFAAGGSAAATFRVDTERTNVAFAVSSLGIGSHQGRFDLTWGKITLDPEHRSGSIDFVVDVGSVDTGWDLRDGFLKSDLMFDAERYPSIRFRSTRFAYDGPRLVAVDGELTMHGVTRPVRFDVRRMECGADTGVGNDGCAASVSGHILRSAFGMSFGYPLVGDEVALDFSIRAIRVPDDRGVSAPDQAMRSP
ncbi:MAG TPA: YceI family protein [Casimicrobiaceae bacterium]|nr:YceI family protein [Casimicrobiaceae bacterium]